MGQPKLCVQFHDRVMHGMHSQAFDTYYKAFKKSNIFDSDIFFSRILDLRSNLEVIMLNIGM